MILSCNHRKTAADFIELGKNIKQYKSVNECFEKNNENIGNDFWIKFKFLNNPYNLDDKNVISIYANSKLVYRGTYNTLIDLKGNPNDLFSKDKRMIISMEILTDKTKKVIWKHGFQSKTVFSWNENYKIIYCGFFPTNEDVEKVFFIPQLEPR
jgi:hypothetical protein